MEKIKLTKPMYVVKANKRLNLYLGVAHGANAAHDKITDIAQNTIDFALYFKEYSEAKSFLDKYLESKKDIINERNLKYYSVETVDEVSYEPNANIFVYNIPVWFSTEAYCMWRRNPSKFKKFQ